MSQEATDFSGSPTRKTRLQEKEELAYLNDRFASYIEEVRSLKEANIRYEFELKTVKDQIGQESEEIKKLYEAELADARNLIDETAKEKARQQLIASKNANRVQELEIEVKELKEELDNMRARVTAAERKADSMESQRKAAYAEKSALQKRVKDLEAEADELRSNVEELKSALEVETLSKVDYQNNVQSLNEELAFRKKVYEEELQSLRTKQFRSSFSETFETFQDSSFSNLEGLDELRDKCEGGIADFKSMWDNLYKNKLSKLESQSERDAETISQLNRDMSKLSRNMSEYKAEISRLQKEIEKLEGQVHAKDSELALIAKVHAGEKASLSKELHEMTASYEKTIAEYSNLMDLKVHLDQEIATYRALLQEEENRLNITPTPRGEKRRSRTEHQSASKKARLDTSVRSEQQQQQQQQTASVSSSAAGCIQICDVDPAGRYVQIKNLSNTAESIGNFKIVHEANNKEITFRFHQKSKLQGGAAVTVWGSEATNAVHNPPHNIIWRSQTTWGASNKTVTKLISKTGEVVATFTQRSEVTPTKPKFDTIDSGASVRSFPHLDSSSSERESTTTEHIFHQEGDPRDRPNRESCIIS